MLSKITRVALRNYRSIASCDVELQPLTLLVGPNGSGKSNFLDGLRFLVHSMHAPLEQVLEARSGVRSILRKMPKGRIAPSFSIKVGFQLENAISGTYALTVGGGPEGGGTIEEEHCQVGADSFVSTPYSVKHTAGTTPAFTGDRPALVAFGALPAFAPVFNLIAAMTLYSPSTHIMRLPASIGTGHILSRDASNAADVLARLQRTSPETVVRIRGYLTSFNPEFSDVTVTEAGNYRWLAFTPASNPSNWTLTSSDVSDGTLRAIAILLAIFQAATTHPPVSMVGLEEPESNLHPAASGVLLDALLEASSRVPIVASTHSANLLDRKDLPDASLLAFALQAGETVIGPIDDNGKAILRRQLYTAGELLRSNQLNPAANTLAR